MINHISLTIKTLAFRRTRTNPMRQPEASL